MGLVLPLTSFFPIQLFHVFPFCCFGPFLALLAYFISQLVSNSDSIAFCLIPYPTHSLTARTWLYSTGRRNGRERSTSRHGDKRAGAARGWTVISRDHGLRRQRETKWRCQDIEGLASGWCAFRASDGSNPSALDRISNSDAVFSLASFWRSQRRR